MKLQYIHHLNKMQFIKFDARNILKKNYSENKLKLCMIIYLKILGKFIISIRE